MPLPNSGFLLPLALLAAALAPVQAQNTLYTFGIDQDAIHGAPDFSSLNHKLEAPDRLFVRDGHFYRVGPDLQPNTADDERVRLFGVNLTFGANFPAAADAQRIAARLRKLGINLVRLHHMDSSYAWDPNGTTCLVTNGPFPTLNQTTVARLRGFLTALRDQGIYADLNLHVGFTFRPATDGVPYIPAMPDMSKPLHIFYPKMVDLQRQYASKVLTALSLKGDPVLGMVEINNESSLLFSYQTNWDDMDRYVTGEYQTELQRQWNEFLGAKYGTTDQLRNAWGASQPDGPEQLAGSWQLEQHGAARATLSYSGSELIVTMLDTSNWLIVKKTGFSASTTQQYVAEVEMRADLPGSTTGSVYWSVMEDVSPWRGQTGQSVTVTNQWQKFRMAVYPAFDMNGTGRFHLGVENAGATLHIRNASFRRAGLRGLDSTESLGSVSLVTRGDIGTTPRMNDYLLFLADRDRYYVGRITEAVREGTDSLTPVTGTQMGFGGLLNLDSQRDADYQDNHFYVDHYEFPHTAWDGYDWRIRDRSSAGEALRDILEVAIMREAGKPYTVSEFNQPWPNTHAAEIDPILAAFGAFQDWDAIMHFDYNGGNTDWDRGVPAAFDLNGDMTKLAGVGQAAFLFRTGAVRSGFEPMNIPVSLDSRLQAGRERRLWGVNDFLATSGGFEVSTLFQHPVQLAKDAAGPLPGAARQKAPSPYVADTGELSYDADRKLFLIHSPRAAGILGFAGTQKATAGALELELASSARGFASVLLTSLDGKPLASSASLLLSNPGYSLRKMPGWQNTGPEEIVNYPGTTDTWTLKPATTGKPSGNLNGGSPPMYMERIEAYATVRTAATSITVYPLNGTGARQDALPAGDVQAVSGGFRIHLQADGQKALSPWYEIAATGFSAEAATNLSAASFQIGPLAQESIVAAYGEKLAAVTAKAEALPLPTDEGLGGTRVLVRDSAGVERAAPLFYVSPGQVNYQMPAGTAEGAATVTITAPDGSKSAEAISVVRVAPGMFSAGSGLAAANALRVRGGLQSYEPVARWDGGKMVAAPIDLGPDGDEIYLVLYGTGLRFADAATVRVLAGGIDAPVLFAGAQGMVGLDQVNVRLPRELAGRGEVDIVVIAGGKIANTLKVVVK